MNDDPDDAPGPGASRRAGGGADWMEWFDEHFGASAAPPPARAPAAPAPVPVPPAPVPPAPPPVGHDDGDGEHGPIDEGWDFLDEVTGEVPVITPRPLPGLPARVARRVVRRPADWIRRPWPTERIVQLALTACTLVVTTWVMFRVVHLNPFEWAGVGGSDLVFDPTTPAGGDLGAHVWAPAYLRDHLLPHWQLNGWSMDWYEGLPVYRFYMVVPALMVVALDTFLAYGVALKVVAVSGMVTLPWCCWAFGRLARFRYPMPELFAFAGLCFVLNESYYLLGGNVRSTMAGEFSFSIAVSFMMLGLGLLCRGLDRARDGAWNRDTRRVLVWAAVVLALAGLSHGIVLIYTVVAAVIIVLCRCGADLWRVISAAALEPGHDRRPIYALVISPVAVGVAVLAAQLWRPAYGIAAALTVAALVLAVVVGVRLGRDERRTVLANRVMVGATIGALTVLLSAFWVGPFLLNHQYMTDMKYQAEPSNMYRDFWAMIFDQKLPLDLLINFLAGVGLYFSVVRRHVYGVAIGITMFVAIALVYLTRDSLPVLGLLWNPRVLPFVYLTRYLLMMIGAAELCGLVVRVARNRPARSHDGWVTTSATLVAAGLVVLVILGWAYQELPGAERVTVDGEAAYRWGPFTSPGGQSKDALGDAWTRYNFDGYERRTPYAEYYDLVQAMAGLGETNGCGRALWERDQRDSVGNERYGSSMALMLLPFWTDGCIASSEGLYFEASGTTPYHFLAAAAVSENAGSPVRQTRNVLNDGAVGVRHMRDLGIRYLMVTRPAAIEQAEEQPDDLVLVATSGPWNIYEVQYGGVPSEIVEPLTEQPVVVNARSGDPRECWLEVGESWFQQPDEWAARPADDGPADWQRIDVRIDETRQIPKGQGTDGCGDPQYDPGRKVNIVVPDTTIEPVALDPITVGNVVIGQQSVSFDVSQVGVPVLVKVSYFPNWQASGADGPYRVAPNFMVVVPTSTHVSLTYGRTTVDYAFDATTLVGIVAAFGLRFGRLPRRKH